MGSVSIFTSFLAGVIMFLAPCTLPLVPGFVSFISHGEKDRVIKNALLFCLGFILTFMLFGLLAGLLGGVLLPYRMVVQKIGAFFVIILGFYMLGFFNLPFFHGQIFGESLRKLFKSKTSPFFFGVSIALGWSPCVGPVLAGIFFYATFSFSLLKALWLFLFFSIGFVLPFMVVAYLVKRGKKLNLKSSKWFSVLAGVILILIGILLFSDSFFLINRWMYNIFVFLIYE